MNVSRSEAPNLVSEIIFKKNNSNLLLDCEFHKSTVAVEYHVCLFSQVKQSDLGKSFGIVVNLIIYRAAFVAKENIFIQLSSKAMAAA